MDYIRIAEAAEILGVSEGDARAIVKFFGVDSKDGEQPVVNGRPFGKAPKLYKKSDVEQVKDLASKFRNN